MEWIDINKRLPKEGRKVKWKTKNGLDDVGIFLKGQFHSLDLRSINFITHWKYLDVNLTPKN